MFWRLLGFGLPGMPKAFYRETREGLDTVLEEIIDALCRHVSDDSPMIPSMHINTHKKVILSVILARLDDSVQLTAVLCLLSILESSLMVWSMFYLTCPYRFTIFSSRKLQRRNKSPMANNIENPDMMMKRRLESGLLTGKLMAPGATCPDGGSKKGKIVPLIMVGQRLGDAEVVYASTVKA
ncbi:hypothetical protein Tco_0005228 [Tanacetum coccineum]